MGGAALLGVIGCGAPPPCLKDVTALGYEDASPLGSSAAERLEGISLEYSVASSWRQGQPAGFVHAGDPVSIDVALMPLEDSVRFFDRRSNPKNRQDGVEHCPDELVMDMRATVTSDDGRVQLGDTIVRATLDSDELFGLPSVVSWRVVFPVGNWPGDIDREDFTTDSDHVDLKVDGCMSDVGESLHIVAQLTMRSGKEAIFGESHIFYGGDCDAHNDGDGIGTDGDDGTTG